MVSRISFRAPAKASILLQQLSENRKLNDKENNSAPVWVEAEWNGATHEGQRMLKQLGF